MCIVSASLSSGRDTSRGFNHLLISEAKHLRCCRTKPGRRPKIRHK
jgi:hypothetical protein